jgi:hypothetical protein
MGENLTASNTLRLIIAVEHCANLAPFARRASHRRDRLDLDHEIRSVQLRYLDQRYRRRSRRRDGGKEVVSCLAIAGKVVYAFRSGS